MTLDISFVFEIDTVLIAKIVPIWSIGIVSITHVVDITLQHKHNLFLHLLACNSVSALKTVLVTVNTLHLDWFAVEVVITSSQAELIIFSFCLANFNFTESHVSRSHFNGATLFVKQAYNQSIAVRLFSTPLCRISNSKRNINGSCFAIGNLRNCIDSSCTLYNLIIVAVEFILVQLYLYLIVLCSLLCKVTYINLDISNSILILCIKIGTYTDVA